MQFYIKIYFYFFSIYILSIHDKLRSSTILPSNDQISSHGVKSVSDQLGFNFQQFMVQILALCPCLSNISCNLALLSFHTTESLTVVYVICLYSEASSISPNATNGKILLCNSLPSLSNFITDRIKPDSTIKNAGSSVFVS